MCSPGRIRPELRAKRAIKGSGSEEKVDGMDAEGTLPFACAQGSRGGRMRPLHEPRPDKTECVARLHSSGVAGEARNKTVPELGSVPRISSVSRSIARLRMTRFWNAVLPTESSACAEGLHAALHHVCDQVPLDSSRLGAGYRSLMLLL
jgi:hypothetical protein